MPTKAEIAEFERKAKGTYVPPVPPFPELPKEIFFLPVQERAAMLEKWNKKVDDWRKNVQFLKGDTIPTSDGTAGAKGKTGATGPAGPAGTTTVVTQPVLVGSSGPSAVSEVSVTEMGLQRQVFIGQRGDNRPGKGTATDPYNGNTVDKFDAVMADINKVGPYYEIVLLPGTYETRGWNYTRGGYWKLRPHCRLRGCGMGNTTLRLVDATPDPNQAYFIINGTINGTAADWPWNVGSDTAWNILDAPGYCDWSEVMDLTLDCNYFGQPNQPNPGLMTQAVHLDGNHVRITRVRVINCGNNIALECFPVVAGPPVSYISPSQLVDLRIEGVIYEKTAYIGLSSGGVSAIGLFTSEDPIGNVMTPFRFGVIRECFVDGTFYDGFVPYWAFDTIPPWNGYPAGKKALNMAFIVAAGYACIIENNYAQSTWIGGPYNDTWNVLDLTVRNNRWMNVFFGGPVYANGTNGGVNQFSGTPYYVKRIIAENNDISLRRTGGLTPPPSGLAGMKLWSDVAPVAEPVFGELVLRGNRIRFHDEGSTGTLPGYSYGMLIGWVEQLILEDNLISLPGVPTNQQIYLNKIQRLLCRNNRRPEDNSLILPWSEDLQDFLPDWNSRESEFVFSMSESELTV